MTAPIRLDGLAEPTPGCVGSQKTDSASEAEDVHLGGRPLRNAARLAGVTGQLQFKEIDCVNPIWLCLEVVGHLVAGAPGWWTGRLRGDGAAWQ